jgi:hypothetical protein
VSATRLSPVAMVPEYTLFSLSAFTLLTIIGVTYSRFRVGNPTQAPASSQELHPHRL